MPHVQVIANQHETICGVNCDSQSAPEISPDELLMNRLLFDEGGPPSAPLYAEV